MRSCFVVFSVTDVRACLCPALEVKERVELMKKEADAIFTGTVGSVEAIKANSFKVVISVESSWIAEDTDEYTIYTSGASPGGCGVSFLKGRSYLVYAKKDNDGRFVTEICWGTREMSSANEDLMILGKPVATFSGSPASTDEPSAETIESPDDEKAASPVMVFGTFSNRESNGEHEWGYEVELWSYEGDLVGMFIGSAGTRLVGDPPVGVLKDVMYNSHIGGLSFRTALPNDDYAFEGVLSDKELRGTLFDLRAGHSQRCDEAEKLVLVRSPEMTAEMEEYPSIGKWKERMSTRVKRTGVAVED